MNKVARTLLTLTIIVINIDCATIATPDGALNRKFLLEFQYACREGLEYSSCKGEAFWNGYRINLMYPFDYNIHTFRKYVYVEEGENSLKFQGMGTSDCYGLSIKNVKLTRVGTTENIVKNGRFSSPYMGYERQLFDNIPGWSGNGFDIGYGKIFNSKWGGQVCELDGHGNGYLTQKWRFDSLLRLIYC